MRTCHRKDADEQSDVPSGQHDFLAVRRSALRLPGRPHAHAEDQQVEEDDGEYAQVVNRHLGSFRSYNSNRCGGYP